ncbi:D-serine ammonia-lyase [Sphaerotilus hippei]|uniref:Probable D-serine dehydratase n=1 Tax=Sphaerotilus hippei TaxID=744406 RepID=A0A318H1J0_9BURK|nr:D-serine ammonia-lyase [Sphaerotilus hippei]PXW95245.1 D-serine ammonia-lyase [Sphaerotilus hippei]
MPRFPATGPETPATADHTEPGCGWVTDGDPLDLDALRQGRPLLWCNPGLQPEQPPAISLADIEAAQRRLRRFAPLLGRLFPELAACGGVVESALLPVPRLGQALGLADDFGRLLIKADHGLPVAGSIKARGGFHEVLEHVERLALQAGLFEHPDSDPLVLLDPAARALLARHTVAVGSTGNLGLSIGVMAAALGLQAQVHMSADAKAWKKAHLRRRGVTVIEHDGDYASAVAAGRQAAAADPHTHFVDDERSRSLLLGYATAALHLHGQLLELGVVVDAEHPLLVYLPCGVGGAPAGITVGLKHLYGPDVHCFFIEPTQSPCFLVHLACAPDGAGAPKSVYDLGLSNRTEADGLAVPQASELAGGLMAPLLSGVGTVDDDTLFHHLFLARSTEGLKIEPSAAAGLSGPGLLEHTAAGAAWLRARGLQPHRTRATHLAWSTGGLFVPEDDDRQFLERGRRIADASTHSPTL